MSIGYLILTLDITIESGDTFCCCCGAPGGRFAIFFESSTWTTDSRYEQDWGSVENYLLSSKCLIFFSYVTIVFCKDSPIGVHTDTIIIYL